MRRSHEASRYLWFCVLLVCTLQLATAGKALLPGWHKMQHCSQDGNSGLMCYVLHDPLHSASVFLESVKSNSRLTRNLHTRAPLQHRTCATLLSSNLPCLCLAASFVTRSGNQLYKDGKPFYHVGFNAYW